MPLNARAEQIFCVKKPNEQAQLHLTHFGPKGETENLCFSLAFGKHVPLQISYGSSVLMVLFNYA